VLHRDDLPPCTEVGYSAGQAGSVCRRQRQHWVRQHSWLQALSKRTTLVSHSEHTRLRQHHQPIRQASRASLAGSGQQQVVVGSAGAEAVSDSRHAELHTARAGQGAALVKMRNLMDSQYVGPIGVGTVRRGWTNLEPQAHANVVFDTGSTNLWIASTLCKQKSCAERTRYNPEQSVTYSAVRRDELDVEFGTGELRGRLAVDDFHVGPFTVKRQTFGMIQEEIGEVFDYLPFEGILGLGFPSMAVNGSVPLVDNVIQQKVLPKNEFSFFFTRLPETASAVFFGGVDSRFYDGQIRLFPVVEEYYWTVELVRLSLGAHVLNLDEYGSPVKRVIFDTGTTYFTAPSFAIGPILDRLPSCMCSEVAALPTLTYTLRDGRGLTHDVDVPPSMYMVGSGGHSICDPAFMEVDVPDEHGPAFLLGEVFMRHFYTVFQRGDGTGPANVGLARARHDPQAMEALEMGDVKHGSVTGHEHFVH